jgi:hypothetical protein
MVIRLLHIISFIGISSGWALGQCNGSVENCSKRYDEVVYLTTHNAYNAGSDGFSLPNQNNGLTQQLNDGVRGLMLDVHDLNGTPSVYHGTSILGNAPLQSNLAEIKTFLDNNPNEIVTIIFECYVSANTIEAELTVAGLYDYLYTKPAIGWNTLQEMINTDDRLVILSDVDDAGVNQDWYHYAWDYCVETHYSVNDVNAFTDDYNRGDAQNDLFIFNHFVTNGLTGTGMPNVASVANEYNFLMSRIQNHYNTYVKFPNYITLDFYDIGQGMDVVDSLNSNSFVLGAPVPTEIADVKVGPNPASDVFTVNGLKFGNSYSIRIYDLAGTLSKEISCRNQTSQKVGIEDLPSGLYTIHISDQNGIDAVRKLVKY